MCKRQHFFVVLVLAGLIAGGVSTALAGPAQWVTWWGQVSARRGTYTLQSQAPTSPGETHSALLTSAATWGDQVFTYTATTTTQLRGGSAPNPWEVAWSMFHFRDLTHYYWFIVKPNGWELGKKQGSDTQIFLATGAAPARAVGTSYQVRIQVQGARIRAWVDGMPVVDYTDASPLAPGAVGLYEEDSRVQFTGVSVTAL